VKEMLRTYDPLAHRRLRGTMDVLLQNCDMYLGLCTSLQGGSGAGKTKLDRYRTKTCRNHIVSTADRCSSSTAVIHSLLIDTRLRSELAVSPWSVSNLKTQPIPTYNRLEDRVTHSTQSVCPFVCPVPSQKCS